MEILSFAVVMIMAVRCVSYGITAISEKNIVGAIAIFAVAIASLVCGAAIFY